MGGSAVPAVTESAVHPLESDRRAGHFRSLLAQFGLTPKSKRGLAASDQGEAVDPLDGVGRLHFGTGRGEGGGRSLSPDLACVLSFSDDCHRVRQVELMLCGIRDDRRFPGEPAGQRVPGADFDPIGPGQESHHAQTVRTVI